jgi:hypothetical protein
MIILDLGASLPGADERLPKRVRSLDANVLSAFILPFQWELTAPARC